MKKLVLVICFLLIGSLCWGAEKTIVAAGDPWPPFVDPSHPKEGLSLELVRAAFKTQGYTLKMEYVPWARAEKGVKEGKYDILANTWVTEKRKGYLMYSESYAVNRIKFIKNIDDPFEYKGIESLKGKKIGIVRSYGYGSDFMNAAGFKREEAGNMMTNIKKLIKKRVDLTLEDEIVARVTMAKENPEYVNKVRFTKNALSSNALHVTCGLVNPRHKEIIESFNKGLAEIKKNGDYKKILADYGVK